MKNVIEYSRATRRGTWLRTILRRLVRPQAAIALAVLCAIAALCGLYRYPWLIYGSRDEYQWRRMCSFALPPTKVVYEEASGPAATLRQSPPDANGAYVGDPNAGEFNRSSDYIGGKFAAYLPPVARALTSDKDALAFLHERKSTTGNSSLVIVFAARSFNARIGRSDIWLRSRICTHDESLTGSRNLQYRNDWKTLTISPFRNQILRIYAGQPDPKDDAHFTIKYEIDNVPGLIDGRLESDDTVTLKILSGPATTQPTAATAPAGR